MRDELKARIAQINAGTAPAGYKKTKVGIVPEEWDIQKAGKYIVEHTEKSSENNQYPVLTSSRKGLFLQSDYYNKQVASEDNTGYNVVPYGYFTYRHMSDDEIFKFNINLIVEKGIVSTLYPVFTLQGIDKQWFLYTLNNGREFPRYARAQKQGGSRTYMYLEKLKKLKLAVPPLPEQQKIAEILTAQDAVIALMQKQIELLQKQKKAFLQKMFPKKGCTVPEIRFAGFTDAWEQRKLGECVTFLDTMRKPLKESEREKGIYPYYGASGIVDYVSDYIFDEELVLLSEDGANITDRNYPVCFLASGKYWVNNHAHVLKVNAENENNFICNSLERMDFTQYNSGMAMPKLNKDVCYNIPLFCPVYEEQKQIGDFFRNLDNLITLHQRKLEIEQQKKKALMQLLLTGKVRCV